MHDCESEETCCPACLSVNSNTWNWRQRISRMSEGSNEEWGVRSWREGKTAGKGGAVGECLPAPTAPKLRNKKQRLHHFNDLRSLLAIRYKWHNLARKWDDFFSFIIPFFSNGTLLHHAYLIYSTSQHVWLVTHRSALCAGLFQSSQPDVRKRSTQKTITAEEWESGGLRWNDEGVSLSLTSVPPPGKLGRH